MHPPCPQGANPPACPRWGCCKPSMNSISSVVRGTAMAMSPVHHKGPECACRDQMRVHIRVCVCVHVGTCKHVCLPACRDVRACALAGLRAQACTCVCWHVCVLAPMYAWFLLTLSTRCSGRAHQSTLVLSPAPLLLYEAQGRAHRAHCILLALCACGKGAWAKKLCRTARCMPTCLGCGMGCVWQHSRLW